MSITYDTKKALPCEQLRQLFMSVGWSDGQETPSMLSSFNVPFVNSTIVVSAWDQDTLAGCVRVLSDRIFRSVIYDLAVSPQYQRQGIGKELVRRCMECFPDSEWLVQTVSAAGFYESIGFKQNKDVFFTIPSKWFLSPGDCVFLKSQ